MGLPHQYLPWILTACALAQANELQPLSDEFGDPSSLPRWQRLYQVENWGHDQLETWDIDTTTAGQMRMQPFTSSWFNNLRGVLVHKRVTGNFIATARLTVGSRHNPGDPTEPPNRAFSLAGIFVHRPIPSRLAPRPMPEPPGTPVWPPPLAPAPGAYITDWLPGQENYIFLSFGAAGNPGTRQYEVKTTLNSSSQLYYDNRGVPDSPRIDLQLVIVGETAVVLRRHPGGPWIVENRYVPGGGNRRSIPSFDHDGDPATLPEYQVGITTYTDWETMSQFDVSNSGNASFASQFLQNYSLLTPANGYAAQPDLFADVDYLRFARPHPDLTEDLLRALPVDFDSWNQPVGAAPLALLPPTGAGQFLGDHANIPLGPSPDEWRVQRFGTEASSPAAAWEADFDQGGRSNLFEYLLGGDPDNPGDDRDHHITGSAFPYRLTIQPDQSVAAYGSLSVESTATLDPADWATVASKPAGSASWTLSETGVSLEVIPESGQVTLTIPPAPGGSRFYRLRGELP